LPFFLVLFLVDNFDSHNDYSVGCAGDLYVEGVIFNSYDDSLVIHYDVTAVDAGC
jgi:hypothetical protein